MLKMWHCLTRHLVANQVVWVDCCRLINRKRHYSNKMKLDIDHRWLSMVALTRWKWWVGWLNAIIMKKSSLCLAYMSLLRIWKKTMARRPKWKRQHCTFLHFFVHSLAPFRQIDVRAYIKMYAIQKIKIHFDGTDAQTTHLDCSLKLLLLFRRACQLADM